MHYITSPPVLIQVLLTLAIILALNAFSGKLIVSILCGTLLLGTWTRHDLFSMSDIVVSSAISINNLMLILTVCQVIILSRQMQNSGIMKDLVDDIKGKVSKHAAMGILPALIGFLPMPGGALFSAPMVQSCDPDNHASDSLKAITNHWFRHVWECWWPMFPGVLLTMELTGFDVPQMILLGMPVSIAAILAGYFQLLRKIPAPEDRPVSTPVEQNVNGLAHTFMLMMPIIVVIVSYGAIRTIHAGVARYGIPPLNRYLPMSIGLIIAMLYLQIKRPVSWGKWRKMIFSKKIFNMALLVLAVRIYGAFIEAETPAGLYLVDQMRVELSNWGIPLLALVMILPFVTGLATGMAVGYIGASFPIVLSLIGNSPSIGEMLSMTVLAYGFGYIGFLLSPVHVCLVVTSEHFHTSVVKNMFALLKPAFLVLAASIGLSIFWKIVLA